MTRAPAFPAARRVSLTTTAGALLVAWALLSGRESRSPAATAQEAAPPKPLLRVHVLDDTNGQLSAADDPVDAPMRARDRSAPPSSREFDEAVASLDRDPAIGAALREHRARTYRPMPPLIVDPRADAADERTIAVGLLPVGSGTVHEIVGVRMPSGSIVRYEGGAPGTTRAVIGICGVQNVRQQSARGVPGRVLVTVTRGTEVLWRFVAVRPAASSGANGSGIELRSVEYRGRRLLSRAHVPILTVRYDGDYCGPFRDWQNEEGLLEASGTSCGPGFLLCDTPASTVFESGSDAGTFLGTAIYVEGSEVVLRCKLMAGWYRYLTEWRFHADGTIRPRFGFSATDNSCVCRTHHHHAYWRFDFDIGASGVGRVTELEGAASVDGQTELPLPVECRRDRLAGRDRRWRVADVVSGAACDLVPGARDGLARSSPDGSFATGDLWVLRHRAAEIDDEPLRTATGRLPYPSEPLLDGWANDERVEGQHVVLWYGAHTTCDPSTGAEAAMRLVVGPELRLVDWTSLPPDTPVAAIVDAPTGTPQIEFDRTEIEVFGSGLDEPASAEFTVRNDGTAPLHIDARSECGCTPIALPRRVIEPGGSTSLVVSIPASRGPIGSRAPTKTVHVTSNDPDRRSTALTVRYGVSRAVALSPDGFLLDSVFAGGNPTSTVDVSRGDGSARPIRVTRVEATIVEPTGTTVAFDVTPVVTLGRSGSRVRIRFPNPVQPGRILGEALLHTDDPKSPVLRASIEGFVVGRVLVDPARVTFGSLPSGTGKTAHVRLRPLDPRKPLRDVTAISRRGILRVRSSPVSADPGTWDVAIELPAHADAGSLVDTVDVTTTLPGEERIEIPVNGVVEPR